MEGVDKYINSLRSENEELHAELESLRAKYEERGAAMRETGAMVRSLYYRKLELFGLDVEQIEHCKKFYESRTGERAEDIGKVLDE